MVSYDPLVIQQFAEQLYSRARSIVITYTLGGALVGFFAGALVPIPIPTNNKDGAIAVAAVVAAVIGFLWGRAKAFMLKLTAQMALCQVQIEKNTRVLKGTAGDTSADHAKEDLFAGQATR